MNGCLHIIVVLLAIIAADSQESPLWFDWATKGGASLHTDLRIAPDGSIATTKPIHVHETLLSIPADLILKGDDEDLCKTARLWAKELQNANSKFRDYFDASHVQNDAFLPAHWTDLGQELLNFIMLDAKERQILPPHSMLTLSYASECRADKTNDVLEHAYILAVQRGSLIPFHDALTHSRSPNTQIEEAEDGSILVKAARNLKPGEELTTSYQEEGCVECGGTPEIFRDFGFLESYPQRYVFHYHDRLSFDIDLIDGSYVVNFLYDEPPDIESIIFLEEQLFRLEDLTKSEFQEELGDVPKHEYDMAWNFLNSYITAMIYAIDAYGSLELQQCDDSDGSCQVITDDTFGQRYDALEDEEDPLDHAEHVCWQGRHMDFPDYGDIQDKQSLYQHVIFFRDSRNNDLCFELDTTVQICSSYRAHYHESVVHLTARHLETIKRVVFVGGGDSMLLHEILKYPSLELVMGLELDQTVTRLSFAHFGTQPHWDKHEKVQWWYGDAAKSLMMLPKDYFGSFDMVLVDLSETVMSMTVTEGLDIFGALALLLHPKGIIVKNELYLENFSEIFEYTIQVNIPEVPVICSQHLIFGSYENDMLYNKQKDHKLEGNLFIDAITDDYYQYEMWHDYRRKLENPEEKRFDCRQPGEEEKAPSEQTRSPGILMVLEAENMTKGLQKSVLEQQLQEIGCNVLTTSESQTGDVTSLVMIMEEGYIVARYWEMYQYCAFDIHLWGGFEKHETIKRSLLEMSGSETSSAYRIVAGGLFGADNWKEDEMKRGPKRTRLCPATDVDSTASDGTTVSADSILQHALKLLGEKKKFIAVVCGPESVPCKSDDLVSQAVGAENVLTIRSCDGLETEHTYLFSAQVVCEKRLRELLEQVSSERQIEAMIIDRDVPYAFGQVLHRALKSRLLREQALAQNVTILAASESSTWRNAFMDRFRTEFVVYAPVFRAKASFSSETSSPVDLYVFSSGDRFFFETFVNTTTIIESELGLEVDIRNIEGGLSPYEPKFDPTHFFLDNSHDAEAPFRQWQSQKPLGRQSIYQFEQEGKLPLTVERVDAAILSVIKRMDELSGKTQHETLSLYEGNIDVLLWPNGGIVILRDGRFHIDVNVFTQGRKEGFAEDFTSRFQKLLPGLELRLRDEQPRGYGGVVNFWEDIEQQDETPCWAL